jgi:hypothetical protein
MVLPLLTAVDVERWSNPDQVPVMSESEAEAAFHTFGPRARFLKTLPLGAVVLDVGAGDGSSLVFKEWPAPARPDLRMFAWAGDKGEGFEKFEGWEVGYWPETPPRFEGMKFDAIFSANFLEHIAQWQAFIRLTASKINAGGYYYVEWPRFESIDFPSTKELLAVGVDVTTGKYHDDLTHQETPPDFDEVLAVFDGCGLSVVEQGVVRVPMIDQQLAIYGRKSSNRVSQTLAYWSMSGWCQYIVARVR